ncbi:flagellar hook protein FlgE [Mesorhizobium sp. J428]|uniref:flagellar hook protein FlgE n=1 Tax=Mesorhizobium sp. J428 TaxID=2898440 RepID=UPI002150C42A|nr:flagellar hook protein FlgE [Mesorhizobium sp. J428]MCR5855869.1 flagellar hook protein FlgE [Mesorhizobium sp. J428]
MSLYGMMRTGVSGMNAQSNRLSTTADNIANSSTNGYKRAKAEFSSLVLPSTPGAYNSGGVTTSIRYAITDQGALQYTTSISDLAVKGNGMFVVQDAAGNSFMTRAGSFVPDGNGQLVNAAGFTLMGYDASKGVPTATTNGFEGLVPVSLSQNELNATPSTKGSMSLNLPALAEDLSTGDVPSDNLATSKYTAKSSMQVYDDLGGQVVLDIYFTKTGADTWEVAVYNKADAGTNGGFPYSSAALSTETLTFDPTTGDYTSTSPTSVSLTIPGGQAFTIDLENATQLKADYTLFDSWSNGNAPSSIEQITIDGDGTLYAQYGDGTTKALYRIPLATTRSDDMLTVLPGNVYRPSNESGSVLVGFPEDGTFGSVVSGALENSNVDIADELTSMIEAQRSYTANSKVFQTGADLMDILVNLKR